MVFVLVVVVVSWRQLLLPFTVCFGMAGFECLRNRRWKEIMSHYACVEKSTR